MLVTDVSNSTTLNLIQNDVTIHNSSQNRRRTTEKLKNKTLPYGFLIRFQSEETFSFVIQVNLVRLYVNFFREFSFNRLTSIPDYAFSVCKDLTLL